MISRAQYLKYTFPMIFILHKFCPVSFYFDVLKFSNPRKGKFSCPYAKTGESSLQPISLNDCPYALLTVMENELQLATVSFSYRKYRRMCWLEVYP
jgi:hypothetical protein